MRSSSLLAVLAVSLIAGLTTGCSKQIGDQCGTNVDCAVDGTRFCDIAPLNGYCTVEGCDEDSCPGNSVCVRFYTAIATEPCTYDPNDAIGTCQPDERCLCDQSTLTSGAALVCSNNAAHCAPEDSERRWCMARCGNNGDCRVGYECRVTGTLGSESVPSITIPQGENAKFCVSTGGGQTEVPTL